MRGHLLRGLLGPDQFIALAEANGQIDDIGRWVIDEAASQLSRWHEQGDGVWPVAVCRWAMTMPGPIDPEVPPDPVRGPRVRSGAAGRLRPNDRSGACGPSA